MTDPLLALQGAVLARLNGDAPLTALLGGQKSFEHVPPSTAAPWIFVDDLRTRDHGADGPVHEHRFALVCVSRQPGTKEALEIARRVADIIDGASLTLSGHRLVNLALMSLDIIRAEKPPARKTRQLFRAVTEPL